jgi:NAD(P)-dependent dehydrogenase (short-subunit alcohol dehydrogenase family)
VTTLFDLSGRVALVVGAGGGLGRAISKGLAEAGADVALADLTLALIEDLAADIRSATGRRIAASTGDVTRRLMSSD